MGMTRPHAEISQSPLSCQQVSQRPRRCCRPPVHPAEQHAVQICSMTAWVPCPTQTLRSQTLMKRSRKQAGKPFVITHGCWRSIHQPTMHLFFTMLRNLAQRPTMCSGPAQHAFAPETAHPPPPCARAGSAHQQAANASGLALARPLRAARLERWHACSSTQKGRTRVQYPGTRQHASLDAHAAP